LEVILTCSPRGGVAIIVGAALEIEALLGRRVSEDTSGGAKASAEEAIMQAKQHNKRTLA